MHTALEAQTGMASGKKPRARRGKGKKPNADHRSHLHKAHEALAKGDNAAAKRHAFDFVKALGHAAHDLEETGAHEAMESPAVEAKEEAREKSVPSPAARKSGNPLVQALMRGR